MLTILGVECGVEDTFFSGVSQLSVSIGVGDNANEERRFELADLMEALTGVAGFRA